MNKPISQIYGTQSDSINKLITDKGQRKLTLNFIKQFPKSVYVSGLRKIKAKGMVEAISEVEYKKGNHEIRFTNDVFGFYYRGTLIYTWDAVGNQGFEQNAGKFEGTDSTRNQRKEILKAIENFNQIVFNL